MAQWLLKTEPGTFSFDDLTREKKTVWDGVTNNLALKNMRSMCRGDEAFIYHSGDERAIVGVAAVVSDPYPDPKYPGTSRVVIDVAAIRSLRAPVTLDQIKKQKEFASFDLVRNSRLSIMPVSPAHADAIHAMADGAGEHHPAVKPRKRNSGRIVQ